MAKDVPQHWKEFEEQGEEAFRKMESGVLREVAKWDHAVISTGGGIVMHTSNLSLMRSTGAVVYLKAAPDVLWKRIEGDGLDTVTFAWKGGPDIGDGHYYTVQGPRFLIEYDNTQNDANHIHSVWRDYISDWGDDMLGRHYADASADHGHDH